MNPPRALLVLLAVLLHAGGAFPQSCVLPDNGSGTVDLPPECPDGYIGHMTITDGLPPGTTLEIDAVLGDFYDIIREPGGEPGSEGQGWDAYLSWEVTGTGQLAGYARTLTVPVFGQTRTAPRTPGEPVQSFETELYFVYGTLYGDPDFCALTVRAGRNFNMPSYGTTTLTRLPSGDFAVDSFFDVTYRIEFEGCPGSPLEDYAGSSLGTHRFRAGEPYYLHSCVLPDNGAGTIDLPPECPAGYLGHLSIVDGLPVGTTIEIDATLTDFAAITRTPGGPLGGERQEFTADLRWVLTGTGDLAGYARTLTIPVDCIFDAAARTPGDPVQVFGGDVYRLQGVLYGDPDFCALTVRAGTEWGRPSPGTTVLTELPGDVYAVESFFDVAYEIDFEGCPGSPLEGLAGTTAGTDRFEAGEPYYFQSCVIADNGAGTIDLPPDCPEGYEGPMTVGAGLPPFTTIEIDATLTDFTNLVQYPGGSLGGEVHECDGMLYWSLAGTGELEGYFRNLAVPVEGAFHSAPRTPGDPIQSFDFEPYRLTGELFGDPDFCTLRVRAGAGHGLPSPGRTTLTELPSGDFAVDSFFDVTYEIEFEGCPGSPLEDLAGTTTLTARWFAGDWATGVEAGPAPSPVVSLRPRPNPFNPNVTIEYALSAPEGVATIQIYDVRGRLVRTLRGEVSEAGTGAVTWNGRDDRAREVSSGVYFSLLRTDGTVATEKMLLIR